MVAMFSPEQVDAHLGKMNNTIQYFPDTPEGRAEKAEEPVSKKEIDELKQMLKKKEEMDAKQNELIANESHINREQQKDIDSARDILGKKMQESESTILSVLESQWLSYNSDTWLFSSNSPTRAPWARLFGSNTETLEKKQSGELIEWQVLDTSSA